MVHCMHGIIKLYQGLLQFICPWLYRKIDTILNQLSSMIFDNESHQERSREGAVNSMYFGRLTIVKNLSQDYIINL